MKMTEPLNIMIGFDQKESVATHTLIHSILSRSSKPVSITPICLNNIKNIYTRERDEKQSNDFTYSRFLTPYLSNYEGWSVYLDCDMMLRTDINTLFDLADPTKAVMVVKHDYVPSSDDKYLNNRQYNYHRKNWSSLMLFNNKLCKGLTPDYINTAPAMDLHQFRWLDDHSIGSLPIEWNHLVGEYEPNHNAKNVHWTIGGPYFEEYSESEFAKEWFNEFKQATHCSKTLK